MVDDYLVLLRCQQRLFEIGHVILTVQCANPLSNVLFVRLVESRGILDKLLLSARIVAIATLFLAALADWSILVRVTAFLANSLRHLQLRSFLFLDQQIHRLYLLNHLSLPR